MKPATWIGGALLFVGDRAQAVDVFTEDTFLPYTVNDANAILANRTFIQSMLAFDAAPFTAGLSTYQARVDWARADGSIYRGSLDRTKMLLSVGGGHPTSGTAAYAVLNVDGINSGPWPSLLQNATGDGNILAESYGIVFGGGFAHRGWVVQAAYFFHKTAVDADDLGRLGYCDPEDVFACSPRDIRSGAPDLQSGVSSHATTIGNTMFTLQSSRGYSAAALIGPTDVAADNPATGLASLRFLAQPTDLLPRAVAVLGAGLTTFIRGLDYYGDGAAATQRAIAAGEPAPARSTPGIVEIPLSGERIADTGATARVVVQASPVPAFRLAEAGYFYEGSAEWDVLPQLGGRAKIFRRDTRYVPSADAYAGFFWVFHNEDEAKAGRGLSAYATYSYNSPDAANLVPLADAHIFGLQVVFGNPSAMPPPSSLVKYPSNEAQP